MCAPGSQRVPTGCELWEAEWHSSVLGKDDNSIISSGRCGERPAWEAGVVHPAGRGECPMGISQGPVGVNTAHLRFSLFALLIL